MDVFAPADRRELVLQVQAPTSDPGTFFLARDDGTGHDGSGVFAFDPDRRLATGDTWGELLGDYLDRDPSADRLAAFGRDLFRAVIEELADVRDAWSAARGAAGREPLVLTASASTPSPTPRPWGGCSATAASSASTMPPSTASAPGWRRRGSPGSVGRDLGREIGNRERAARYQPMQPADIASWSRKPSIAARCGHVFPRISVSPPAVPQLRRQFRSHSAANDAGWR